MTMPPAELPSEDAGLTSTAIEATLCELWREILELECVDVDESFFDLGGESIAGTLCASRIQALFGVVVPLSVLLDEHTTVRSLANRVAVARRHPDSAIAEQ